MEARKNNLTLKEVIDKNVRRIPKDMLVTDIFNLIFDSPAPLAVVEDDRLVGVVIRGSVLEALADTDIETGEVNANV